MNLDGLCRTTFPVKRIGKKTYPLHWFVGSRLVRAPVADELCGRLLPAPARPRHDIVHLDPLQVLLPLEFFFHCLSKVFRNTIESMHETKHLPGCKQFVLTGGSLKVKGSWNACAQNADFMWDRHRAACHTPACDGFADPAAVVNNRNSILTVISECEECRDRPCRSSSASTADMRALSSFCLYTFGDTLHPGDAVNLGLSSMQAEELGPAASQQC